MNRLFQTAAQILRTHPVRSSLLALSMAGAVPSTAMAHHDGGLQVDIDFRGGDARVEDRHWCEPVVEQRHTRVWVEPVYRAGERVWIAPVYRTVVDRVWREPVVNTVCEDVYVPARYEVQDVVQFWNGRRHIVRQQVLVEAAHRESIKHDVVVTPGHFEDVQRQELVCDGHWQDGGRQELVVPGHFEDRGERLVVAPGHFEERTVARVDVPRWGR